MNGTFRILVGKAGSTPLYIDKACLTVRVFEVSNDGIHWKGVDYGIAYCVPVVSPPPALMEGVSADAWVVHKTWILHPSDETDISVMQLKVSHHLAEYKYLKIIIEAKYYPVKELYEFKGDADKLSKYFVGIVPY